MPPPSRRHWLLVLLLLLATGFLAWSWRPADPPAVRRGNAALDAEPPRAPRGLVVPAAPVPPPASPGALGVPAREPLPPAIAETIRANAVPGRILFLDFTLGADGLALVGASGAAGRAKPAGTRSGLGLIQYEVRDASGQVTGSGWVEDPTRRRVEYSPDGQSGRIASTILPRETGSFVVRLAGEDRAHRITLFRESGLPPGIGVAREVLGDFVLQPSSPP